MFRKQRWTLGLLLLLVTSAIFADGGPQIASDAVTNHSDLSMNFLSQIFGTVGNVLSGTSGQMMGKLFYDLNIGVLIVAGMWLSYTIFNVVVSSASEGSFINGRNNVAMIFLRIAIGTGALLPSPSTGYSVIQDVVMKVVVEGVKLADMTWSHGLDYIQQGGDVWHAPLTSKDGGSLTADTAKTLYQGTVSSVMEAEACMVTASAKQELRSQNTVSSSTGVANNAVPPTALSPIDDKVRQKFYFPSSQSDRQGCGSVDWGAIPGVMKKDPNTPSKKIETAEGEFAYEASYHVVYNMIPAAKLYVCSHNPSFSKTSVCSGTNTTDAIGDASEIAFNNVLAYVNSIEPLVSHNSQQSKGNLDDFFKSAKSLGWLSAGRYSWDISHFKDLDIETKDFIHYNPKVEINRSSQNDTAQSSPFQSWSNTVWGEVQNKFDQYSNTSNDGNTGGSSGGGGHHKSLRWLAPIVGGMLGYEGSLAKLFNGTHMGSDPIYFLHRVGVESMNIAGEIWINLAITIGALYLVGIICSGGSVDLDRPIEGAVSWFKPLAMALAMMYLTVGGMLAFYVPLYAFLVFSFGVISWFIAVIEAMVAAPLVAFGLTHPEGHDFLGPIKQALMLLLGVFLRPVLTVIGLIAAMILSYVSFRMINFGFASFMGDLLGKPGGNSNNVYAGISSFMSHAGGSSDGINISKIVAPLIGMPIMLFIYAMVVYYVINQCYSLVYVLPDYILRWIGGPQQQSSVGQMMEGLKGGFQQNMGSAGQGMNQSAGNAMQGAGSMASVMKPGSGGGKNEVDQKGDDDGKSGGGKGEEAAAAGAA